MIDRAERFLRERGFQPLRVRYHKGDVARIEVAVEQLPTFADAAVPPRSGRLLEVGRASSTSRSTWKASAAAA